ncbi:MAG: carbamoyltransferase HypF [Blastocatellia bacterium]
MRTQILVRGTVQGVGFRPYVFSLATKRSLKGTVLNNSTGVVIEVEGSEESIGRFVDDIGLTPPPLSIIESVELKHLQHGANFSDFRIVESNSNGVAQLPVSADVATCDDCLRELFDPNDRRYRYPFTNCTNCGPRFSIVEGLPYDRERTTMREFEMCCNCRAEYEDPLNRRFHAEPTACAKCGPQLFLSEPLVATGGFEPQRYNDAGEAGSAGRSECVENDAVIVKAKEFLQKGKILAIKGLGGYHLACDALNADAVNRLRQRKYREDKPFALMAPSVDVVRHYCDVSDTEADLLKSRERPIVLLDKKNNLLSDQDIPDSIAPGVKTLGLMLPYTPLHYLLFEGLDRPLVMTSGNISDEPICYRDREAAHRLMNVTDYFLTNDRRIHIRTDDSIVRTPQSAIRNPQSAIVLRRSRGFAPAPVKTSFKFKKPILACGAELKNTFCLARGDHAYISHHIGDLENLETLGSFTKGIEHFKQLFDIRPEVVAYDLHPEYLSTKYALKCDEIDAKIGVQHHHAHIASCMADNGATGELIGVAMDGLGFGTDGKLWGGEFFVADFKHADRVAHLDYIPLPGGAMAIREPWRPASVYLQRTFGDDFLNLDLPFIKGLNRNEWKTLDRMVQTGTNCPETSSMGRLFDAVSALLGVRSVVNYEGQAAIELEAIADECGSESYQFEVSDGGLIKTENVIRNAVEDLLDGRSTSEVSAKFHLSAANLIATMARSIRDERRLNRVALSGGVFQNMLLLRQTCRLLESDGFDVLIHRRVPTNDGGISLGQAAIANALLESAL